jgi:hypothetical protein
MFCTECIQDEKASKLRKVIKLGKSLAITVPRGYIDSEYVRIVRIQDGFLVKKVRVEEPPTPKPSPDLEGGEPHER